MSLTNQSQFIGHVGNDPEVKTLPSGKKVATFSLATNESYKDKSGEKKTITDWHSITAFGSLAELIEKYVKRGSELAVSGRHKTDSYEDKDKIKRFRSHFIINELRFLGKPKDLADSTLIEQSAGTATSEEEDELPF